MRSCWLNNVDKRNIMRRLELLIPPPIIMLATGLVMWLLAEWFPEPALHWDRSAAGGVAISLLGVVISLAGVLTFKRASTTVDPRRPAEASTLVTTGIYRYSRNPMYLGVLLVLIGWAVILGNLISALAIVGFVAYITRYQIIPEERLLQEKFSASFTAYKGRVRRWI